MLYAITNVVAAPSQGGLQTQWRKHEYGTTWLRHAVRVLWSISRRNEATVAAAYKGGPGGELKLNNTQKSHKCHLYVRYYGGCTSCEAFSSRFGPGGWCTTTRNMEALSLSSDSRKWWLNNVFMDFDAVFINSLYEFIFCQTFCKSRIYDCYEKECAWTCRSRAFHSTTLPRRQMLTARAITFGFFVPIFL